MQFQWYPGHMTKAKRQMQEDIKLIDLVIELVDARIPLSSRNPDIDELGRNKARLILMNKSDLADEEAGKLWSAYFQKKGYYVVSLDSRNRNGMKQVTAVVMEACKEKIERQKARHHEPSGAGDGRWNPERGEIHVYQFLRRKGVRQDRQQAGRYKGQAVDPAEQECRTSGYTGNLMAKV